MINKIIKNLKASLPKIKHIQDLRDLERDIFFEFREEKQKRDKAKKGVFKPGDKVVFLIHGAPEKGIVERILTKKIEVKADEGQWLYRCNPSLIGLRMGDPRKFK